MTCHHNRREWINGNGAYDALLVMLRHSVADGLGEELSWRVVTRASTVIHALLLAVLNQRDAVVLYIVKPRLRHHTVYRWHCAS